MIRALIGAWYAGVEASAKDRLITRNAVSLVFLLPRAYQSRIEKVPGVTAVSGGLWFGGIYKDEQYHLAQFAVDPNYFEVYNEFAVSPKELEDWHHDKRGALVGKEIAERFGLKPGDQVTLKGTIFPGNYELVLRGIFYPKDGVKDTKFMVFQYDYLNEANKTNPESHIPPDQVGFYGVKLASGFDASKVSEQIDDLFKNSYAETLTQTETAFVQGFISMSSALILALNAISLVVIPIVLLVLSNTMLMTVRERFREYSILRAIGFGSGRILVIIIGESICMAIIAFIFLSVLLVPVFNYSAAFIVGQLGGFFPKFPFEPSEPAERL